MKVYIGERTSKGCEVWVLESTVEGMTRKPLEHVVLHSPDGFEWGYGGSGPSELALSLLLDLLNETTHIGSQAWDLHHAFTKNVVAGFNQEGFCISAEAVKSWVRTQQERKVSNGKDRETL